ncbi:hypothetical protein ACFSTH_01435 [Paenibacillus yanchengensis]
MKQQQEADRQRGKESYCKDYLGYIYVDAIGVRVFSFGVQFQSVFSTDDEWDFGYKIKKAHQINYLMNH